MLSPVALRDAPAELVTVRTLALNPSWLDAGWTLPADWLTCFAARAVYEYARAMYARGEAVALEAACGAAGVNAAVFWTADLDTIRPSVPDLTRRLWELHQRRRVRLVALAVVHQAEDVGADLEAAADRLRRALDEAAAACPLPRRQRVEVAA